MIKSDTIQLNPIELALDTVTKKNKQLRHLVGQYSTNPEKSLSTLTMTLNGVIDAAVNGGITKYQEVSLEGYLGKV